MNGALLTCLPASGIARDSVHPGLVSIPGSQSVLAGVHSPPNTPSDGPVCFLDGAGGCVLFPTFKRSRAILSLTKRHEPGSQAPREGSDALPCVGFHGSNHEGNHGHEAVKACQGFGNVCRA